MIGVLLGIPIGIICSIIAWWIIYHLYVPKILIADKINRYTTGSFERYRLKIQNVGKRKIIDLDIRLRLKIKGYLVPSSIINYKYLKTDKNLPVLHPIRKTKTKGWMILIHLNESDFLSNIHFLPPELRSKAVEKRLLLEDILKLGDDAAIQLILMGYDEYSGSRKAFFSKWYRIDDIEHGIYEQHSLKIIPGLEN